jgi:monoamine oxidase
MAALLDVVIVGAGAAGLSALRELDRAGLRVCCLEAQARVGGRIFTLHDPLSPAPIELGAEFVHGRPPEILNIARRAGMTIAELGWNAIRMKDGKRADDEEEGDAIGEVMSQVEKAADAGPDESFASFIGRTQFSAEVKRRATRYVEGFNAADAGIVGIASLAQDALAADKIDGDRSFFVLNGYDSVPLALLDGMEGLDDKLRLNSVVERIVWKPGEAAVHLRSALDGRREILPARRVIVTVSLGVLQAEPGQRGAIAFDPEPGEILAAAKSLAFGQVVRVTLRLHASFRERRQELSGAGFIFSEEPVFPTWWTTHPAPTPLITGWSAGPAAAPLLGQSRSTVLNRAIGSLERISGISPLPVLDAYWHDWHADPFFRGAYSYTPAGKLRARQVLAEPIAGTLYFAGETVDLDGHSATVHGAIASGIRAAHNVIGANTGG